MRKNLLVAVMAVLSVGSANAHEISEVMEKPIRATLVSPRKPFELELCVADAITQIGGAVPIPVRDGPENVVMLGYGHTPKIVISMTSIPQGTQLDVRTKSADMDDKLVREIKESCNLA